jgi:hypothetical protein
MTTVTVPHIVAEQDLPDVWHMAGALQDALARLLPEWRRLTDLQKDSLVELVRRMASDGRLNDLVDLDVDSSDTAAALHQAMLDVGQIAARQVVDEAARQGVHIGAVTPRATDLSDVAAVVAAMLAAELSVSAARAAMRANHRGATPDDVASDVRTWLTGLSGANAELQLGGTLHGAMNAGRLATIEAGPEAALYASEVMDKGTCRPCLSINGKWLGNSTDLTQVQRAYPSLGYGGYVHCKGGIRCRGTVVAVYRPEQTTGPGARLSGRFWASVAATRTVLDPTAHLPGKHDQSSHGKKRKTAAAESPKPGDMASKEQIHAAYDYTDAKTGLTARVTGIQTDPSGERTLATIEITDRSGRKVGESSRFIEGDTVHHNTLKLEGSVQGQGFAARFNRQAEEVYRANGIKQITLLANDDVGGYAWARAGYDFRHADAREGHAEDMTEMAQSYSAPVRRAVARLASNPNATPADWAMLGHTPGATTWPGKEMMLDSVWQGVKRL